MRRYLIFVNTGLLILFIPLGIRAYHSVRELYLINKGVISLKGDARDYQAQERLPASLIGMGYSINYYNSIREKDLFRPQREEYVEPLPSEEDEIVENEIPPPAVDLYGIMIEGERRLALIYDRLERERNLRFKVVSSGTEIQGHKLILIEPEQIIFERNGRKTTVELSQAKSAIGGIMPTSKKSPTVIEKRKGKAPSLAVSVKKKSRGERPPKTPASGGKEEDNVKYEIIETPFGKIKKRLK